MEWSSDDDGDEGGCGGDEVGGNVLSSPSFSSNCPCRRCLILLEEVAVDDVIVGVKVGDIVLVIVRVGIEYAHFVGISLSS